MHRWLTALTATLLPLAAMALPPELLLVESPHQKISALEGGPVSGVTGIGAGDRFGISGAFLGDLDVIDNGLLGRGSATVTGRHGYRIAFFESFAISRGGFDGWGFDDVKTRGMEFRLAGPLKIIGEITGSSRLSVLANHYDVRFTRSVYFHGDMNESTFSGISFVVKR